MTSRATTAWDVIRWDILGIIAFRILLFAGVFSAAVWVAMVFWGMVAERTGVTTISYATAALGVVGLWLAVSPMAWLVAFRVKKGSVIEF